MMLARLAEALSALLPGGRRSGAADADGAGREPAERFRGTVEARQAGCIGCGACAEVCPSGAISVRDDAAARLRSFELDLFKCVSCGLCVEACPTGKGIVFTRGYDTATLSRSEATGAWEKELALCEIDGAVVAPVDQLKWVAARTHELGYANPTLVLHATAGLKVAPEPGPGGRGGPEAKADRSDTFRVLCPACRRTALLGEEWEWGHR